MKAFIVVLCLAFAVVPLAGCSVPLGTHQVVKP